MTNEFFEQIGGRVRRVQEKIGEAALRSGRRPEDITLVGVTKTQPAEAVRTVLQAGVRVIGENRVQELLDKAPQLEDLPHESHLIGHLQRNKAKYLPGHIQMLQSLDSEKTAEALEKAFGAAGQKLDILIEVNIGGEDSKTGIDAGALEALADRVLASDVLALRGLMTIPPFLPAEEVRPYFRQMYKMFVDIRSKKRDNDTVNILSMGMSADYEAAIEEGATMVRVGSELFGPRPAAN